MKKILFLCIFTGILLTSCKKDEIGNTATVKIAGEWVVTADVVDANGSLIEEDFFGVGEFFLMTYNTAKNVPTEFFVDDQENFWEFKIIVNLDYENATFSSNDYVDNYYYDSQVKVTKGKVSFGTAKTPSGMPADSFEFEVWFDDDPYAARYGYDHFRIHGYRYTGFEADEP